MNKKENRVNTKKLLDLLSEYSTKLMEYDPSKYKHCKSIPEIIVETIFSRNSFACDIGEHQLSTLKCAVEKILVALSRVDRSDLTISEEFELDLRTSEAERILNV